MYMLIYKFVELNQNLIIIIIIIINIFVKRHRQSYRGAGNESIRRR